MAAYEDRYTKLNDQQRAAVDHIDGPLLVVAGPGTGKTELLSMRAASILKHTDTLPNNILCLTFTDSGANAMRERLSAIIGPDAYKVAIHTFHSFGTEVINQNNEFFYHGADFKPADELSSYELLTEIFDELDHTNPLASRQGHTYTYLDDVRRAISELKQAGLTSDELLRVITSNEQLLDNVETELSRIFAGRMSTTMLTLLAPLAERVAATSVPAKLPPAITPLGNTLALSMARAFDEAVELGKTTPITAWRNEWMEKDRNGTFIFKDRARNAKLRALSHIYYTYLTRMEHENLYDYDDMIMSVVHAMELHADLKYNLQERYQYIMVDEFQDTNLAQLRIIYNLTENPLGDAPNIMAVGDDDQAIYSFQGADVNNIHRFREHFNNPPIITLINNYRSAADILRHAREVIIQGEGRLESTIAELNKKLTPHHKPEMSRVDLREYPTIYDERAQLAQTIKKAIAHGAKPEQITVIARRHNELVELLPYFAHAGIAVNYEKRDNVLDEPLIQAVELILSIIDALQEHRHDVVDSLMPELLSHPAFAFPADAIWKLSLQSYRNHQSWLETMAVTPEFVPLQQWLVAQHVAEQHTPLEPFLDRIIGTPDASTTDGSGFASPLYDYYFSAEKLKDAPDAYLTALEALRTVRTKLREYRPNELPRAVDFLDFIQTHRDMGSTLTSIHRANDQLRGAVNLMTAHKSKGLEFNHVYIIGAVDSAWGERVRSRSRLISYPQNLRISPSSNTYDERLRLFFVAMTRAKNTLTISYSLRDESGRDTLPASFLVGTSLEKQPQPAATDIAALTTQNELSWHDYILSGPETSLETLLRPILDTYKLSATHLNNFIDITRGGPQSFLMTNLLRFPQAKSAQASYGTAIHAALQHTHAYLATRGTRRPVEDVLGDFTTQLAAQHLTPEDYESYAKRGANALTAFLKSNYDSFRPTQKTELNFAGQGVAIGETRLTGSLDLVDIVDNHITVTDYKTGKPSHSWKGSSDAEKIKLHKYKQQLMFYQLLCEHSRDYAKYTFDGGVLQFVEPDKHGDICALHETFSTDELERFKQLICAVWRCITMLDFPDISGYDATYKGVIEFENNLIDNNTI